MGTAAIIPYQENFSNSYIICYNKSLQISPQSVKQFQKLLTSQLQNNMIIKFDYNSSESESNAQISDSGNSSDEEIDENNAGSSKDTYWQERYSEHNLGFAEDQQLYMRKMTVKWDKFRQYTSSLEITQQYNFRQRRCTKELHQQEIGQYFLERKSAGSKGIDVSKQDQKNIKSWKKMIEQGDKQRITDSLNNTPKNIKLKAQSEKKEGIETSHFKPVIRSQNNSNHKRGSLKQQSNTCLLPALKKLMNRSQNNSFVTKEHGHKKGEEILDSVEHPLKNSQEINNNDKIQNKQQALQSIEKSMNLDQEEMEHDLVIYKNQNQKKFSKCLRKGPPMKFRWLAWKAQVLGSQGDCQDEIEERSKKYQEIVQDLQKNSSDNKQIKKDIHRTFPCEKYFQNEQNNEEIEDQGGQCINCENNNNIQQNDPNSQSIIPLSQKSIENSQQSELIGIKQLYRVLQASSKYFKNVGYCQGMNFICAFMLLLSGGNELETFWMFVGICEKYHFLGMFEEGFPLYILLENVFQKSFQKNLPKLYSHLDEKGLLSISYIFKWFETLFLYSFSFEISIRIWDFIFSKDILSIIDIAISILYLLESQLKQLDDLELSEYFTSETKKLAPVSNKEYKQNKHLYEEATNNLDPEKVIYYAKRFQLNKKERKQFIQEFIEANPDIGEKNCIQKIYQLANNQ